MAVALDALLIPGFDNLSINNSSNDHGPACPPPPPPPPMPMGSTGISSGTDNGAPCGPPPPPPPPLPGLGSMPTYKQQKEQEELNNPTKDLAAKLAGGKKSDAKPFSYGISAADLKTPSEIKRLNAARAAAGEGGSGANSPARPSTPSFGRRPSMDSSSTAGSLIGHSGGLPDHGQPRSNSISNLVNPFAARRQSVETSLPQPTPPPAVSCPLPPIPASVFTSSPPPPISQQVDYSSQFAQPPKQPPIVQPPTRTTSFTKPPPAPVHNGSAYDQMSSWAASPSDDESGHRTSSPYGSSPQVAPRPARSRSNSFSAEGGSGPTKAAQMLQNIRSNYSGSNSSPVQQVYPRDGGGRESPARQFSNHSSGTSSPFQHPSTGKPQQPAQTYYYGQPAQQQFNQQQLPRQVPQQQVTGSYPYQTQQSAPQRNQFYEPIPSQAYQQQPDIFELLRSDSHSANTKVPTYVHTSYHSPPPPDLSIHRTLPYSAYVTPSNIDFNNDQFSSGQNNFGSRQLPQSHAQSTPQYTSQFQMNMQPSPAQQRQVPNPSNQWDSGFRMNSNMDNNSGARVIPIQMQYSPVTTQPVRQQWRDNSGMSDF